ncbi:VCBS domain-containing protein [Pseudovibrio sp. WM33]|uniref:VCBS domain-containing protein n=1 Tax=Pseudovibrio sp. WM33 TaxID=1735585 RepID=UPI0007AEB541|nr:VCBS domain-containing protein [Pseudovibrio sp. WM33]KZL17267.1 hypothetical protein PsWM33_05405 [Pseudovibrio sp. WM33]
MPNNTPVSSPVLVNVDENGVTSIRVIFQDSDLSDTHSLTLNTDEMAGAGTVVSDDTFHYDPGTAFDYLAAGETATDTFSYTVTDAAGESSTSTVTITVIGHNDSPIAVAVAAETDESTSIVILPDFTDPDNNDTHSFTVDTSGTIGSVIVNADGTFSYDPNGKFDHLEAGETATDTFTYTVTDAAGESSTETVTVTINGESEVLIAPQKIRASDGARRDSFGISAQINDHGVIVVGADSDDDRGASSGSVYVYTPDGEGGLSETKITASDGAKSDNFGITTVINNHGVIAVSAYLDDDKGQNSGSVYVYTPTEEGGYDETKLIASSGFTNDWLGRNLVINDDGVIVATAFEGSYNRIYVFTPDGQGGYDELNIPVSGYASSGNGGVHINEEGIISVRNGTSVSILTPDGQGNYSEMVINRPAPDSLFGRNVAVAADGTIVVGGLTRIYVYEPDGEGNYTISSLTGGASLDMNADGVIVSGVPNDSSKTGKAFVHVPDDEGGYTRFVLSAIDGQEGDSFGRAVSITSDGVIIVTAYLDDDRGENSGSAYVYTPNSEGNYVGADGTVYEPEGSSVLETFDMPSLELIGSAAAETLQTGGGDDTLTGGEGNDIFVFAGGQTGHNVIKDFAAGEGASDIIEFEASIFTDFDAVLAAAQQFSANTAIIIDDDTSITLEGVTLSDLHQDDFSFV